LLLDFIHYEFMQRALIAGLLISVICPLLGNFIIAKRLSMIGDTLAHVAFLGLALSALLGVGGIELVYIIAVLASFIVLQMMRKTRLTGEQALVVMLAFSAAVVSIIISMGGYLNLEAVLFGSILAVAWSDVYLLILVAAIVSTVVLIRLREIMLVVIDEEIAKLRGVNINLYEALFSVLTALAIVSAIKIAGIMLVVAFIAVPALAAVQISRNLGRSMAYSIIFGAASITAGIISSYYLNIPPGGATVLISLLVLYASLTLGRKGVRI